MTPEKAVSELLSRHGISTSMIPYVMAILREPALFSHKQKQKLEIFKVNAVGLTRMSLALTVNMIGIDPRDVLDEASLHRRVIKIELLIITKYQGMSPEDVVTFLKLHVEA